MPNKVTREVKALCNLLVDDLDYLKKFRARLLAGTLAPQLETMVWYYAKGKPQENLNLTAPGLDALAELLKKDHEKHGVHVMPDDPLDDADASVLH